MPIGKRYAIFRFIDKTMNNIHWIVWADCPVLRPQLFLWIAVFGCVGASLDRKVASYSRQSTSRKIAPLHHRFALICSVSS